jgi:hypothetical protein
MNVLIEAEDHGSELEDIGGRERTDGKKLRDGTTEKTEKA